MKNILILFILLNFLWINFNTQSQQAFNPQSHDLNDKAKKNESIAETAFAVSGMTAGVSCALAFTSMGASKCEKLPCKIVCVASLAGVGISYLAKDQARKSRSTIETNDSESNPENPEQPFEPIDPVSGNETSAPHSDLSLPEFDLESLSPEQLQTLSNICESKPLDSPECTSQLLNTTYGSNDQNISKLRKLLTANPGNNSLNRKLVEYQSINKGLKELATTGSLSGETKENFKSMLGDFNNGGFDLGLNNDPTVSEPLRGISSLNENLTNQKTPIAMEENFENPVNNIIEDTDGINNEDLFSGFFANKKIAKKVTFKNKLASLAVPSNLPLSLFDKGTRRYLGLENFVNKKRARILALTEQKRIKKYKNFIAKFSKKSEH